MPTRLGLGQNHPRITRRQVHPNKFPSLLPPVGAVKQDLVLAMRGDTEDVPRITVSLGRLGGEQPTLTGLEIKILKIGDGIGITGLWIRLGRQRGPG